MTASAATTLNLLDCATADGGAQIRVTDGEAGVDTESMVLDARFPRGFRADDRFADYTGPFRETVDLSNGVTVDLASQLC